MQLRQQPIRTELAMKGCQSYFEVCDNVLQVDSVISITHDAKLYVHHYLMGTAIELAPMAW